MNDPPLLPTPKGKKSKALWKVLQEIAADDTPKDEEPK